MGTLGPSNYDQHDFDIRCEWGLDGVNALAPACDVVIIVDVLCFSSCADVATSRGAIIYPYRFRDDSVQDYAKSLNAVAAGHRDAGGYSLSPGSYLHVKPGTRIVLPSPNGATLSLATAGKPTFAGCLRNAEAVAKAAMTIGKKIAVIPAAEHWHPQETMRPAVEDLLGAGAIISYLTGKRSPEAELARSAFEDARHRIKERMHDCTSAHELRSRGYEMDVTLAEQLNVSTATPFLKAGAYTNTSPIS